MGRHKEIFYQAFEFIKSCDISFSSIHIHIHIQKLVRLLDFPSLHRAMSFLSKIFVFFLSHNRDDNFGECWFEIGF